MMPKSSLKQIAQGILSKPFSTISYETSDHLVSMEEIHPAVLQDQFCRINEFGSEQSSENKQFTSHKMTQPLRIYRLKNVFFSKYMIFDENGNVFPDSFRLGNTNKIDTMHALSLQGGKSIFRKNLRDRLYSCKIESCTHDLFYLDIAYNPLLGHFLAETITRLWYVDTKLKLLSSVMFPDYLLYYLGKFGFSKDNLHFSNNIIFVKNLYIATQASLLGRSHHPISKEIYSKLSLSQKGHEKIYLSRSKYEKRLCIDEHKIEDFLREQGFAIIHPQELDIREQAKICANAALIVGCVGTNMFHRLGNENNDILHISPKGFPSIASYINNEKLYNKCFNVIYGEYINKNLPYSSKWHCSIENFKEGFSQWMNYINKNKP